MTSEEAYLLVVGDKVIWANDPADIGVVEAVSDLEGHLLRTGVYIKWEEDGRVKGRYKFVRSDFISKITDANEEDGHHINRPILPNMLKDTLRQVTSITNTFHIFLDYTHILLGERRY